LDDVPALSRLVLDSRDRDRVHELDAMQKPTLRPWMGSMIVMTDGEQAWHRANYESLRRLEEEASSRRHARWVAFRERIETELFAKRAQRKALEVPTAGPGWCVVPGPCSHEELERFVRGVFDLAFHGIEWPRGWAVKWGEVAFPAANAACIPSARLILFDRRWQKGRSPRELATTALHELVHALHPNDRDDHGPAFARTFSRVLAYYFGDDEPRRPEVVKGRRFVGGPGVWGAAVAGSGEWEFR
jgi:hypothetical protein